MYSYQLFLDPHNDITMLPNDKVLPQEYFGFLQEQKKQGLYRFQFTSKMGCKSLLKFFTNYDVQVVSVKTFGDSYENLKIERKVRKVIKQLESYINVDFFYYQLDSLEKQYFIDVKKIEFLHKDLGTLTVSYDGIIKHNDPRWNEILLKTLNSAWRED